MKQKQFIIGMVTAVTIFAQGSFGQKNNSYKPVKPTESSIGNLSKEHHLKLNERLSDKELKLSASQQEVLRLIKNPSVIDGYIKLLESQKVPDNIRVSLRQLLDKQNDKEFKNEANELIVLFSEVGSLLHVSMDVAVERMNLLFKFLEVSAKHPEYYKENKELDASKSKDQKGPGPASYGELLTSFRMELRNGPRHPADILVSLLGKEKANALLKCEG